MKFTLLINAEAVKHCGKFMLKTKKLIIYEKVQVGKDQEKAQSEKDL